MRDEENQPFADVLIKARKIRGWERFDLADMVGVDVRSLERWEYAECLPQPYYAKKMIKIMPEIKRTYWYIKKVQYIDFFMRINNVFQKLDMSLADWSAPNFFGGC